MSVRVTAHNARSGKDGVFSVRHNDRNFDKEKAGLSAEHIHEDMSSQNYYWTCYRSKHPEWSFEETEKAFYQKHFSEHLQKQNDKYIASGHAERVKSMDMYRTAKQSCPEETLFYLGTKDNHADAETLKNIILQQLNWEKKEFPQVKILDLALHMDEATPHIHERKVWVGHDKDGSETVGQNKALAEMGISRPDLSKKEDRHNNAKQTYTKECRQHLLQLCKEHGLDIIEEPQEPSKSGQSLLEYQVKQAEDRATKAEKALHDLQRDKSTLEEENALLRAEIASQTKEKEHNADIIISQNKDISDLTAQKESLSADVSKAKDLQKEVKKLRREKRILTSAQVEEIQTKRTLGGDIKLSQDDFDRLLNTAAMTEAMDKDYNKRLDKLAKDRKAMEQEQASRLQEIQQQKQIILQQAQRDANDILAEAKEKADAERRAYSKTHALLVSEQEQLNDVSIRLAAKQTEADRYDRIESMLQRETTRSVFKKIIDPNFLMLQKACRGELYAECLDGKVHKVPAGDYKTWDDVKSAMSEYGAMEFGTLKDEPTKQVPTRILKELREKISETDIPLSKDAWAELDKAVEVQKEAHRSYGYER